jgi:quercetin dioxygenase-like cupin family protein
MENFFEKAKIYDLQQSVEYATGAVVSKIVEKNDAGNITLFAFDKGQLLSEHTAPFNALVYVLEGTAVLTINKTEYELKAGNMIIMPANIPHAIVAKEKFKMILIMLKA